MHEAPIVVGVDGSSAATDATAWAADWAGRVGLPLRLLTAGNPARARGAKAVTSLFVRETAAVLESHPDLHVDCVHENAEPSAALIEASGSAAALVIGSRGAGGWDDLRVGSVAYDVSAYARCVVAVIPPVAGGHLDGPVVVGVDGSPESAEAAEFAARQAHDRGLDLLVVTAYDNGDPQRSRAAGDLAQRMARDAVRDLRGFAGRVHSRAVVGAPALALAQAGARASLLVVGSRGAGGFAGKLLGSVSRAVLGLSDRPVAIVRAWEPQEA
ncbi:nucleotide-binding universal stress UspA family protein [Kineosphaera limosa]|uniref:UspA domain-containing protein n=1 Tax=Kineosphaera limosa NBRC 100340 TaxID=1184609 RepID=K6W6R6_9MICO|nr:universal stress protein [Kineosphaera limosa]NYE00930.1 nucleotide-binding universal stress UspA family protein [Kineosphaera limosa]GAB94875.1 hypothetical protein KILIM_014_00100 [Kineosphaera limosa NBRC 100340]